MPQPVQVSSDPELVKDLASVAYRPSPSWLGSFGLKMHRGVDLGRSCPTHIYESVWEEARRLAEAVPRQKFNTLFLQKYVAGQEVKPHRDPRNNLGYTVVGLYGDFEVTYLMLGPQEDAVPQRPGDVFVLPCTIDGRQGPLHAVRWPSGSRGTRYAIILNTID